MNSFLDFFVQFWRIPTYVINGLVKGIAHVSVSLAGCCALSSSPRFATGRGGSHKADGKRAVVKAAVTQKRAQPDAAGG